MQRNRLVHALLEVVAEQGVDRIAIGSVCARAGLSRRTYYELFPEREDCLLAALQHATNRIAADVVLAYDSERDWSARVRAGLIALLALFDADPGLARLCLVETLQAGPQVVAWRKQVLDAVAEAIDEGRAQSRQAGALPALTAQGLVGGALSVAQSHLLEPDHAPLVELAGPLMAMIVQPYLGPAAARRELERSPSAAQAPTRDGAKDPFKGLRIRFTYRTARVLAAIADEPGARNRAIAEASGISDEGQMSRLLRRLESAGLIENLGEGHPRGEPNAWVLTERGDAVYAALGVWPSSADRAVHRPRTEPRALTGCTDSVRSGN